MATIRCIAASSHGIATKPSYLTRVASPSGRRQMERQMTTNYPSDEVFGTETLTLAAIVGATILLLAAFASPASVMAPTAQAAANQTIETVTVTAAALPSSVG
jgi:hypothetical protein